MIDNDKIIPKKHKSHKLIIFSVLIILFGLTVFSFFNLSDKDKKAVTDMQNSIELLVSSETIEEDVLIDIETEFNKIGFRNKIFVKNKDDLTLSRNRFFQQEADIFIDEINKIGPITWKSGPIIKDILDRYTASPKQIKSLVTNSTDLVRLFEACKQNNKAFLFELIDNIGYVDISKKSAIEEARMKYDEFANVFGLEIENANKLFESEEKYAALSIQRIGEVELLIKNIDQDSADLYSQIIEAEKYFLQLHDDEKEKVTNQAALLSSKVYYEKSILDRALNPNKSYYDDEIGNIKDLDSAIVNDMITSYSGLLNKVFKDYSSPASLKRIENMVFPAQKSGFDASLEWQDEYSPIYNLYQITLSYKYNPDPINTVQYQGGLYLTGSSASLGFEWDTLEASKRNYLNMRIDEEYEKLKMKIHLLDSPIEKAIKIAHHFNKIKYDDTVLLKGSGINNNLYGALVNGTTQCNGYAILMQTFLEKFGVDTETISGNVNSTTETIQYSGDNFPHIWNLVPLGQKWYHVDLTWYYDYVDALLSENVYATSTLGNISTGNYNSYNLFFASNKQIKDYQIADKIGRYFILDKRVNPAQDEKLPYSFDVYNTIYASLKLQDIFDEAYDFDFNNEVAIKRLLSDANYLNGKEMLNSELKSKIINDLYVMDTLISRFNCSPSEMLSEIRFDFSDYDLHYFENVN